MDTYETHILFGRLNEYTQGKEANLESTVSSHCTTLLEHGLTVRTYSFDASQMNLTERPLFHYFVVVMKLLQLTRISVFLSQQTISRSKGDGRNVRPRSNFFHFHAVFGKNLAK